MSQHTRLHAIIPGGRALTDTSLDELIRPGLRLAFPLPLEDGPDEARFCRLLDALAQSQSGPRLR